MNNYLMIRRIRGPVYILTAGVLGLFAEFTRYGWDRTWPIWIIVTGLLMFAEYSARSAAIASGEYPVVPPMPPPVYPQGPGSEIVSQPPQYPPVEPR
jgi:hypothetical protein